jgi:hypothetical protein
MRNLTLAIQFCDISEFFVSAIKYENTYTDFMQIWKKYLKNSMSKNKMTFIFELQLFLIPNFWLAFFLVEITAS